MRTRAIGTARAALLTASFVALGASTAFPGSAFADTTDGDHSVLGGNQVSAPISAPINACGNSLALFGAADSACKGGAEVKNSGGSGGNKTSGNGSVGGGNQITAPISAPVNVCGNAAAVFGDAVAACKGGAKVKNGGHGYGGGQQTSGEHSVLGGNQATAPISAPVDVCGNAVGNAPASCEGGAAVKNSGFGGNETSGNSSVGGGNQVTAPVGAPVNVCGNAAAVAGNAGAFCEGGAEVDNGESGGNITSGDSSVLGGNQVTAPVKAPVDVCGNAVAVLGEAAAGCQGSGGYGHHKYSSRSAQRTADDPVALGLPTMPGLTKALPIDPAGTLPALPSTLPQKAAPQTALPVPVDTPPASGLQLPAGLPVQAPDALPVQPKKLAKHLPVKTPVRAADPAIPVDLPGALPEVPQLSTTPELPNGSLSGHQAAAKPAPAALPELPELPVGSDVGLPVVPQKVSPVAAGSSVSSGMDGGAGYVLLVGALLAGASAVMAFARRIRFGRR